MACASPPDRCTAGTASRCDAPSRSVAHDNFAVSSVPSLARTSWVLPTFDDRPPLVVCVGMGGSIALAARRRNVITDGQQCAPLFRKSRIRIIEYRQDPGGPDEAWPASRYKLPNTSGGNRRWTRFRASTGGRRAGPASAHKRGDETTGWAKGVRVSDEASGERCAGAWAWLGLGGRANETDGGEGYAGARIAGRRNRRGRRVYGRHGSRCGQGRREPGRAAGRGRWVIGEEGRDEINKDRC